MSNNLIELKDIQLDLNLSENLKNLNCVKGNYKYYHYNCDGFNDVGFGCGYRTTQTICSWLKNQIIESNKKYNKTDKFSDVPTILDIQKILVECGDKHSRFIGSKDWIGCFESSIVIDYLYDTPCKIKHFSQGNLEKNIQDIIDHFKQYSSPIMMGGDLDNASKGVLGIAKSDKDFFLLIADPHFKEIAEKKTLIKNEWITWRNIKSFDNNSFYNFCLPLKKAD